MAKKKKENTRRFVGKNGVFVPSIPRKDGEISIGYLDELCEYLYFHNNLSDEEKLKHILNMESIVPKLLQKIMPGCRYRPTWSIRLKKDIEKKKLKKK